MENKNRSLHSYVIGFVLSIIVTLVAYYVVTQDVFTGNGLMLIIGELALIQFVIQLIFFLHLGRELRPRWKLAMFWFMVIVAVIIIAGSLWIMQHLDYGMMNMTEDQTNTYLHNHEGL